MNETVQKLLSSGEKYFFIVTGASLIFTDELMAHGGASSSVLGVYQPYDCNLLGRLVGYVPNKYVSEQVALDMVNQGWFSSGVPSDTIMIACTASLCRAGGEREDRVNEAYIAVKKFPHKEKITHIVYKKDPIVQDNRYDQERKLARDILTCLSEYIDEIS